MKVRVLQSFAGVTYSGGRGAEIDLPMSESKSLASAGIVEILEDYTPPVAFETAEEAAAASRNTKILNRKRK
jgi:hypothetical protein